MTNRARSRQLFTTLLAAMAGVLVLAQEPPAGEFTVIQGEVLHRSGTGAVRVLQTGAVLRDGVTFLPAPDFVALGSTAHRDGATVTLSHPGRNSIRLEIGSVAVRDASGAAIANLAGPVQLDAGVALIPVRATEHLAYRVDYDSFTREVTFLAPGGRTYGLTPTGLVRDNLAGEFRSPRVGERVRTGDVVRTGEGRAEISAGGSIIRLDKNSEVTITAVPARPEQGSIGFLAQIGRTWSRIFHGETYELQTPGAIAAASGTAWLTEVTYDDEDRVTTTIQVHDGSVEVRQVHGEREFVPAGQETVIEVRPASPGEVFATVVAARRAFDQLASMRLEFVRQSLASDRRFLQFLQRVRVAGIRTVPLTVSVRFPRVQPAPSIPIPGFALPVRPPDPGLIAAALNTRVTVWAFDRQVLSAPMPVDPRPGATTSYTVSVPVGVALDIRVDSTGIDGQRAYAGRVIIDELTGPRSVLMELTALRVEVDGLIAVERVDDLPSRLVLAVGSTTGIAEPSVRGALDTPAGRVPSLFAATDSADGLGYRFVVAWAADPAEVRRADLLVTDADGSAFRPAGGAPRRFVVPPALDPGPPDVRDLGDRIRVLLRPLRGAQRLVVYWTAEGYVTDWRWARGLGEAIVEFGYLGPGRIEVFAFIPAGQPGFGAGVSRSAPVH